MNNRTWIALLVGVVFFLIGQCIPAQGVPDNVKYAVGDQVELSGFDHPLTARVVEVEELGSYVVDLIVLLPKDAKGLSITKLTNLNGGPSNSFNVTFEYNNETLLWTYTGEFNLPNTPQFKVRDIIVTTTAE